jgi:hypothetical protein
MFLSYFTQNLMLHCGFCSYITRRVPHDRQEVVSVHNERLW